MTFSHKARRDLSVDWKWTTRKVFKFKSHMENDSIKFKRDVSFVVITSYIFTVMLVGGLGSGESGLKSPSW